MRSEADSVESQLYLGTNFQPRDRKNLRRIRITTRLLLIFATSGTQPEVWGFFLDRTKRG